MNNPTVLHVNAETTWRGGENQVFQLASAMHRERSCAVACAAGSPLAERLTAAGVPVCPIPGDRGVRAQFVLRHLIRELRPALLHAHTSRAHQLCRFAMIGKHLPLLVTRRVDFPLKRGPIARWKYLGGGVRFVAISQAIREVLLAGGVPGSRITLIPSGIDFTALDTASRVDPRTLFTLPADAQVVLNVAALSDHKDQATLLRAWTQVEERNPRAHLLIAGDGELRDQLLAQIAASGLRRARLVGYRHDVPGLLKGGDLFVMSSHLEGLCTSIMDAKRCGLAVVATAAGGIPEVVRDGIDGTLVAVRDAQALGAALAHYLADDQLRRRHAEAARADSARFSAAAMVQAYLALYRDVIG